MVLILVTIAGNVVAAAREHASRAPRVQGTVCGCDGALCPMMSVRLCRCWRVVVRGGCWQTPGYACVRGVRFESGM